MLKTCRYAIAWVAILFFCGISSADTISFGAAGNLALFGFNSSSVQMDSTNSTDLVHGNVGVGSNVHFDMSGSSTVTGTIFVSNVSPVGTVTTSGTASYGALVSTNLTQATTDAIALSTYSSSLTATQTFSAINSSQTITATQTDNAITLSSVNLGGSSVLTLSGSAADVFYVNVAGTFDTGGTSAIMLTGGLTADHVLFNITGSGGGANLVHIAGTGGASGVFLAPDRPFTLTATTLDGRIFDGQQILIQSGASVQGPQTAVPLPGTATAGLGLLGLTAAGVARRRSLAFHSVG
jgi:hypothetical protein